MVPAAPAAARRRRSPASRSCFPATASAESPAARASARETTISASSSGGRARPRRGDGRPCRLDRASLRRAARGCALLWRGRASQAERGRSDSPCDSRCEGADVVRDARLGWAHCTASRPQKARTAARGPRAMGVAHASVTRPPQLRSGRSPASSSGAPPRKGPRPARSASAGTTRASALLPATLPWTTSHHARFTWHLRRVARARRTTRPSTTYRRALADWRGRRRAMEGGRVVGRARCTVPGGSPGGVFLSGQRGMPATPRRPVV